MKAEVEHETWNLNQVENCQFIFYIIVYFILYICLQKETGIVLFTETCIGLLENLRCSSL